MHDTPEIPNTGKNTLWVMYHHCLPHHLRRNNFRVRNSSTNRVSRKSRRFDDHDTQLRYWYRYVRAHALHRFIYSPVNAHPFVFSVSTRHTLIFGANISVIIIDTGIWTKMPAHQRRCKISYTTIIYLTNPTNRQRKLLCLGKFDTSILHDSEDDECLEQRITGACTE